MPAFGVAVAWMILAPIALIFHVLAILFIQHYRPIFHSTDVALISLLVNAAMTSYFVIPIPAVLELGGLDWNLESCNFYTWLSSTLRFSHFLGLLVLNVYWVNALRAKSRQGHIFMSSFLMKIAVFISWFVSVIFGLVPVTGGTEIFGFYSSSSSSPSCHFLPSSISVGFGILVLIASLSCVLTSVISSADTLLIFRSMKQVALEKYNAGRFPMPAAGVSGVARSSTTSGVHAKYSDLTVATDLCKMALCLTLVSLCLNTLPFVAMQFMLLFDNQHRGTFEDLTLWLQLLDAILLPHLLWMLSSRYRHAIVYAWKVYVKKDTTYKEEDASSCTLQSYKVRAMEHFQNHQGKGTLNGVKKIQTNGTAVSAPSNMPTTSTGIRRPSGNKISPMEHTVNGHGRGQNQGQTMSGSITELDDGMNVLPAVTHQTSVEHSNHVMNVNIQPNDDQPLAELPNGEVTPQAESSPNDVYSRPLSKIKPLRKHAPNPPNAQIPRVAFVDISETSSGPGSPQVPSSSVSSPAKSLLGTPKRDIDVKRTASACSRKEWKEKMRKKHLPAIFVSNSVEDDKDEKIYSNIDEQQMEEGDSLDSKDSTEAYEMKEIVEPDLTEKQRDTEIVVTNHKQQSFSEDNFYVSSEFHYNYLSDSLPRKASLRTQSTVDSDGVCDMYESDDIGTILDTSMVSDSTSHAGALPRTDRVVSIDANVILENAANESNDNYNKEGKLGNVNAGFSDDVISVDTVTVISESGRFDRSEEDKSGSKLLIKSSLEEFEENERNVLLNDETGIESDGERPVSRLKLIDLENNASVNTNNSVSVDSSAPNTNGEEGKCGDKEKGGVDLTAVSQDYDQLETVSGSELLQLKQQAVKTVRTAKEITFDSSSEEGGIDNEAFEDDDGDDTARDDVQEERLGADGRGIVDVQDASDVQDIAEDSDISQIVDDSDNSHNGVLPEDMVDRYVTGKEDSEESGSSQGNDHDREMNTAVLHDINPFGVTDYVKSRLTLRNQMDAEMGPNYKREDFKTNPFLRESFEVLVQSPEYQQKLKSQDNSLFISVKPLALPRQKTLENPTSSSDQLVVKEIDEPDNKVVTSKPPIASRPTHPSSLSSEGKPTPDIATTANKPLTAKPPVPVRKPHPLQRQTSREDPSTERFENDFKKPRTSSSDELEKIFTTKEDSTNNSNITTALQEDPFFPGEDPSSTVTSNDDCSSPVFYSMSPIKEPKLNFSQTSSHSRQSEPSIVIEPYGQRRPPWLDENMDTDLQGDDDRPFSITVPVTSQYSPAFSSVSARPIDDGIEEYDFDSVKIRGVAETKIGNGPKSNSGSSSFFGSSSSDSGNDKITPVSGEERPTFQFYQFDDDIEKGFEDALSVDYLTHTNVYGGFGLCFESIKEEPEDSLSESTSSFDGLGDSNSSSLFKTQAIISRPSSRASVNSSPNLEVVSTDGYGGASSSSGNRLSVFPENDQGNFIFGENVNYENFASLENGSFVTSERTSGDGREEVAAHSNGHGGTTHTNDSIKTASDPWSLDRHNVQANNSQTSRIENNASPWLEVKNVDLDMSFESDFSHQTENNLMDSEGMEPSGIENKMNTLRESEDNFIDQPPTINGDLANSDSAKSTSTQKGKPNTQTIHYEPVYF